MLTAEAAGTDQDEREALANKGAGATRKGHGEGGLTRKGCWPALAKINWHFRSTSHSKISRPVINTSSLWLTSTLGTRDVEQGISWNQKGQETCLIDSPGGVGEVECNSRYWNWATITSNGQALRLLIQGNNTTLSAEIWSTEY